jgi:hypothetical protein
MFKQVASPRLATPLIGIARLVLASASRRGDRDFARRTSGWSN